MTPTIRYTKKTDRTDPRVFAAVEQAVAFLEGEWGRLNPYWYTRAFIVVEWRGSAYRALVRYSSTQGVSTPAVFYGEESSK
jgi:hypothetical protein